MEEEEDLLEKSNQPIRLEVRGGGFKISAEGTISSVAKELDAIRLFVLKVAEKFAEGTTEPEEETPITTEEVAKEIEKISAVDIPSIKSSKKTIENIETLFGTPWGRTPRSLAEIMKALEVNAIPDRVESVNVYLRRLVQRGVLRRIEKNRKYHYFKLPE